MKEVPDSLKLEFTMAMRELQDEVKKQQERKMIQQAIEEFFSEDKKWKKSQTN
jgi:Fe-S cluster biosynthesis and repair protein YggX